MTRIAGKKIIRPNLQEARMASPQFAQLQLLAELDGLTGALRAWADGAPDWPAARSCQALVRRLGERMENLRIRWEAPLVVATLGGTGTGKSTLVNALVGAEVTTAGRQRPTTRMPTFICRPDYSPEDFGIPSARVQLVHRDAPALRDWVLLDCPDPDTTEDPLEGGTNLARLRDLLPQCDVLLVTTTQQKYRSARVNEELATAATGARLVFVQTHASTDEDIRSDWRKSIAAAYQPSEMFFVDSVAALADAQAGIAPRGEFARLVELLNRELAGSAAHRIRRANFLDLADQTMAACHSTVTNSLGAVDRLEGAITEQRQRLAGRAAGELRRELLASRRHWEQRLLGEVASRWGFSPFALVIRGYHGLGGLIASSTLLRMRSPAQLAIWGALEGARRFRQKRESDAAEQAWSRAAHWGWDESELRSAGLIIDGFAAEAGFPRDELHGDALAAQADRSGAEFVQTVGGQLQAVITKLAARHSNWWVRFRYEIALLAMLGLVLYRLGKNYFYDSWLRPEFFGGVKADAVYGMDFFVQSGFWLLTWCLLLLWLFTGRLRRGLRGAIDELATHWTRQSPLPRLFASVEQHCQAARRFEQEGQSLQARLTEARRKVETPEALGRRVG